MLQLFDESIKDSNLKKALKQNGYITASPIQQKILNLNEEDSKKDILIQAKAGLGKTLAFLLHLVLNSEFDESVIGLIIAPTREVAIQTSTIFNDIIKIYNPKINIQHFIGGNPIEQDIKNVEECNFVVGTPGRIKAIIQKKRQFFEKVQFFCLDEADKLMDKIFEMDLSFIKQSLPTQVKMVVTSATFEEEKLQLLETKYLKETIYLMADGEDVNLKGIQQHYVDLRDKLEERSIYEQLEYKMQHIGKILKSIKFYQAIIFLNKPAKCLELVNMLEEDNWPCTYICGKLTQSERKLAMDKTRNFNVRVLISSDLISRGVDIARVDLIINIELPKDIETYLHRIGRTGRFNTSGIVLNLVSNQNEFNNIIKLKEEFKMDLNLSQLNQLNQIQNQRKLLSVDVPAFSSLLTYKSKRKELNHKSEDNNVIKQIESRKKAKKDNINKSKSKEENSSDSNSNEHNNEYNYNEYIYNNYYYNGIYNFWLQHFNK